LNFDLNAMHSVLTSALQQQRVSRRLDALQQLRAGQRQPHQVPSLRCADRDQEMLRTEGSRGRRLDSLELQHKSENEIPVNKGPKYCLPLTPFATPHSKESKPQLLYSKNSLIKMGNI
jgi:hypothetical protein